MPKIHLARLIWSLIAVCSVIVIYLGLQSPLRTTSAPLSTTWHVTTSSDDANDGDPGTHNGSLRFALTHAISGDLVSFAVNTENIIVTNSALTVPAGVAVGRARTDDCGDGSTPRANIQANLNPAIVVDPVFSLSANSTLRNVDVGGGENSVKITGENVDVCGSGLGILSSGETNILPPHRAVLVIDGARAVIHRNVFYGDNAYYGDIVVGIHGSDSRIGDTLYGSGDSNEGLCSPLGLCMVNILTGTASAAQRVTIRDALPRTLTGMAGNGVSGGDDDPKHANNWAQTPAILTAETLDNFATVHVSGTASPFSLVDIYFDDSAAYTRQVPVTATAAGTFDFWGDLRGPLVPIQIVAVSTLNDPAHPNRVGSSSKFSGRVQVIAGTTTVLQLTPPAITFVAWAGEASPPAQHLVVRAPTISPTLAWQTGVTTTGGANWLAALPSSSSANGVLTVTVNSAGLAQGTYHGEVKVSELGQPTDQATTDVVLVVVTRRVWLPVIIR